MAARLLTGSAGLRSCSGPGTCADRAATERGATGECLLARASLSVKLDRWREEIGCRQAFKG